MRLEFNPRALCYNLYCDTKEEHDKMKLMMEKPLTATNLKSIDNMIYADTDSVNVMKTKLNSLYGRMAMTTIKASQFIELKSNDTGRAILVNKDAITFIEIWNNITRINFNNECVEVEEDYLTVKGKLGDNILFSENEADKLLNE